jgi:hypothetical protein
VASGSVFYSDGRIVYVWGRGSGEAPLIQPASGAYAHDVAADQSDMAWVESATPDGNGHFQTSTLWASPLATSASQVNRRVLASWVCPTASCDVRVQDGYVLSGSWQPDGSGYETLIVRLADGARWRLKPYAHEGWNTGFESGGEIWVPYSNSFSSVAAGLQRVQLSSLPMEGD